MFKTKYKITKFKCSTYRGYCVKKKYWWSLLWVTDKTRIFSTVRAAERYIKELQNDI